MLQFSSQSRDDIDAKRIESKRLAMEQRKQRLIDNPKQRLYGIDTTGLSQQINDKYNNKQAELQSNNEYDNITQQRVLNERKQIEQNKENKRNELLQQQQYNTQLAQQTYDIKKFDTINNNTYNVSFDGEDNNKLQRDKSQKQQQKQWLDSQITSKKNNTKSFDDNNDQYADDNAVFNKLHNDAIQRKQYSESYKQDITHSNRINSINNNINKLNNKQYDDSMKNNELSYQVNSKLLNETYNPYNTKLVTEFKGFDNNMKYNILSQQQQQINDKQERIKSEKLQEIRENTEYERVRRDNILYQQQYNVAKKNELKSIKQDNIQQMLQHKDIEKQRNMLYNTNNVDKTYFDQWGQSAR